MFRPPVLSRMLPTRIGSSAAAGAVFSRLALLAKASAPVAVRNNCLRLNFIGRFSLPRGFGVRDPAAGFIVAAHVNS